MTWAEFVWVWLGGSGRKLSAHEGGGTLKDQINRRRAAKGLAPMKPAAVPRRR
jgi:hypothetical protein